MKSKPAETEAYREVCTYAQSLLESVIGSGISEFDVLRQLEVTRAQIRDIMDRMGVSSTDASQLRGAIAGALLVINSQHYVGLAPEAALCLAALIDAETRPVITEHSSSDWAAIVRELSAPASRRRWRPRLPRRRR